MDNIYGSLCDEFYLEMYVNTELELPSQRDTILTFFERIQIYHQNYIISIKLASL